jgi:hypothetical protein
VSYVKSAVYSIEKDLKVTPEGVFLRRASEETDLLDKITQLDMQINFKRHPSLMRKHNEAKVRSWACGWVG